MTMPVSTNKQRYLTILSAMLPVALYLVILFLPVPISISIFFSQFSTVFFLSVLVSYYLSFRLKSNTLCVYSACLTALIFAMRLSYLWTAGYSGNMILGGLLPFRDGFGY
jgi:hypothetical protein